MAKTLEYNATLSKRIDLTDSLAIFEITPDQPLPEGESWFTPGQYIVLGLNNEENVELGAVQRPMSIASACQDTDKVEFYIRYVSKPASKNPLTHLLWKIQEGERVFIRSKPKGKFTIEDTVGSEDSRLKIFVSAGTGLAPFVSIVRSYRLRNPGGDLGNFAILHGASYPIELGYRDELQSWAADEGLNYISTISRPAEAPDWSGVTGRVEDLFLEERLLKLESTLGLEPGGLRPDRALIYICGLQGTIGCTIERLLDRGFVPDDRRIRRVMEVPAEVEASTFFEQYDSDPVIDLKDEEKIAGLKRRMQEGLSGG
ncbi:MAG TPA: hypothetical protein EYN79_02100 [Planctomycetes bacterium]|nr:hypothetical protein [Planctomycetota bacterium]